MRKEFPFCVTSSSKAHKEFKMHTQRGLFLMEIDTKGQLLTKLEKSKHFKAEFVMTEFMGSKVELYATLHIDKSIKSSRYAPTVLLTEKS